MMKTENTFNQPEEMILTFLRGKITAEELAHLKTWLSEDAANKEYFKEMYMIWKANSIADQSKDAADKAFHKFYLTTFGLGDDSKLYHKRDRRLISTSYMKWAAVIVISICVGGVLGYFLKPDKNGISNTFTLNEIIVPLGSKSRVFLPDHTEVWLNAGSKLTYSTSYGKKIREVNLEGEGYFKVAKMASIPFIVRTPKANIKALGTEFNVKAYPEENTIETILVKGSVVINKVSSNQSPNKESDNGIVLKPGQKVLIYKNSNSLESENLVASTGENNATEKPAKAEKTEEPEMKPQTINSEVETSWKDPNWVIQGENINDVFIKLGRRFNVSIASSSEELDKYKFSGIIQNETLEQVFDLMSLTIPMSYEIEKGKVEISLNTKLEKRYKRAYRN